MTPARVGVVAGLVARDPWCVKGNGNIRFGRHPESAAADSG